MKKIIILSFALLILISFSDCSSKEESISCKEVKTSEAISTVDSMRLEDIFTKIESNIEELPETVNITIDKELFESFLFIKYIDGAEALASEGAITSVAHSAVLLRLKEGSDVEKVCSEIEANLNPNKWICVGAEKTAVVSNGNTILLVMSFNDITDKMVENFNSLYE